MNIAKKPVGSRYLSPGERFWIGAGLYVLVADMILWRNGHLSMSQEFGGWLKSPLGRYVCGAGTAFMFGHLFLELPLPGQTNLKKVATYHRNGNGNGKKVIEL